MWGRLVTFLRGWIKKQRASAHTSHQKETADRDDRVDRALEAAAKAEAEGDADAMRSVSYKLIRFELYERAWQLRARATALKQPSPIPEWDGSDVSGRSILIRSYAPKNRIGEELRLARFIAPVAQRARRCIVLAEPRLVPLLRRSFAGVDVRPRDIDDAAALAEVDVTAYYETIALHYAKNAEEMRCSFVPLRADPTLVASVRERYKMRSHAPIVGISWGSSNDNKVLPDLKKLGTIARLDISKFRFVAIWRYRTRS